MTKKHLREALEAVTPLGGNMSIDSIVAAFERRHFVIIRERGDDAGKLFRKDELRDNVGRLLSQRKQVGEFENPTKGIWRRIAGGNPAVNEQARNAKRVKPTKIPHAKPKAEPRVAASEPVQVTTEIPPFRDSDEARALLIQQWEREEAARLDAMEIAERQRIRERLVRERLARLPGARTEAPPPILVEDVPPPEPEIPAEPVVAEPVAPPVDVVLSPVDSIFEEQGIDIRPAARRTSAEQARSSMTVPERIAAAMGDGVWDAGGLEAVLQRDYAGSFKVQNLRAYISSVWSATRIRVAGPNGQDIRKPDGTLLEIRQFEQVERGRYRVRTADEMRLEARRLIEPQEVSLPFLNISKG